MWMQIRIMRDLLDRDPYEMKAWPSPDTHVAGGWRALAQREGGVGVAERGHQLHVALVDEPVLLLPQLHQGPSWSVTTLCLRDKVLHQGMKSFSITTIKKSVKFQLWNFDKINPLDTPYLFSQDDYPSLPSNVCGGKSFFWPSPSLSLIYCMCSSSAFYGTVQMISNWITGEENSC